MESTAGKQHCTPCQLKWTRTSDSRKLNYPLSDQSLGTPQRQEPVAAEDTDTTAILSQLPVPVEEHPGTNGRHVTSIPRSSQETVSFLYNFLPFLNFSNSFYNFLDFQYALAAVSKLVVSSDDILAGLWELHSEALADILDLTIDYDILEMPPPIQEEVPQWMVNFMSSDKEPAEPNNNPPPGFPELPPNPTPSPPPLPSPVPEPLLPDMPELTWDDYLMIAGLEEIEPPSDHEELQEPSSPTITQSPVAPPMPSPEPVNHTFVDDMSIGSSAEPESSMEFQIHR